MAAVKVARSDRAVTVSNFSERVDFPWIKRRPGETLPTRYVWLTSLRLLDSTQPRHFYFQVSQSHLPRRTATQRRESSPRDAYHWYLPQALPDKGGSSGRKEICGSIRKPIRPSNRDSKRRVIDGNRSC